MPTISKVAEKSGQSGGTQRNAQKGSNKKPRGKKEILHSSSNDTKLSTSSSTKVVVSSRRVSKESDGSGGTQQNVSKSSKEKPRDKMEILHSSSNDTKLSTPYSTEVAVSSRRVGKKSNGSGGTQQNVPKNSKEKPHDKKEILHSSSNDTKLSTPSTKVAVSSRKVGKESGGSGDAQQNVRKSSKEKPHDNKKILHSSSNDTKLSTPSSTKVAVSNKRVGKESGGSGGTQQNSRKSSKEKPHGKKEILHSSSNDTKLSTSSSSTKVVVSSRRVGKKSGGSCGTQPDVPKSSKKKPRGKKKILHSSRNDTELSILSSTKVVVSSRSVVDESGGNGDTQQNVPKISKKKRHGKKEILHASSKDTRQSTSSSTKVAVSSRSGGIQQNVPKSSKKKPRGKKEIFHSSRNNTGLSTASTKVLDSSRRVVEESSGSGGTQQNVLKSSKKKLCSKKKIVQSSRNGTRLSKSSSIKVVFSNRRVAEESTGSGDTQQNVQKSFKKKLRCKKKILHSSSNDTRPSSSSTKVIFSSRRVAKESSGSGDTQQNVKKSSKKKHRGKKKILQVSSNVTRLSTCPKKVVDSSRRRVIAKNRQSGGTQKNVWNSSKIKTRIKKVTLKEKKHYQSSSKRQLAEEENIEFWKSKYGKAICTINELKESPCFKQFFDQWNIPLEVINHSGFLCRWIAPPVGWVSLNTDGALNHANASCGGLIRDNKGKVLQFYHAAVDRQAIHHIELLAIAHGLGVALEGGRGRIWVQSDSKCAIDIINGEYSPPCNSIAIVDEIKRKMEQFEEIRFSHVFREMNKPADLIAKWGVGDLSIYGHPIPKELDIMVQKDAKGSWYFRKYKGDTDEMDQ